MVNSTGGTSNSEYGQMGSPSATGRYGLPWGSFSPGEHRHVDGLKHPINNLHEEECGVLLNGRRYATDPPNFRGSSVHPERSLASATEGKQSTRASRRYNSVGPSFSQCSPKPIEYHTGSGWTANDNNQGWPDPDRAACAGLSAESETGQIPPRIAAHAPEWKGSFERHQAQTDDWEPPGVIGQDQKQCHLTREGCSLNDATHDYQKPVDRCGQLEIQPKIALDSLEKGSDVCSSVNGYEKDPPYDAWDQGCAQDVDEPSNTTTVYESVQDSGAWGQLGAEVDDSTVPGTWEEVPVGSCGFPDLGYETTDQGCYGAPTADMYGECTLKTEGQITGKKSSPMQFLEREASQAEDTEGRFLPVKTGLAAVRNSPPGASIDKNSPENARLTGFDGRCRAPGPQGVGKKSESLTSLFEKAIGDHEQDDKRGSSGDWSYAFCQAQLLPVSLCPDAGPTNGLEFLGLVREEARSLPLSCRAPEQETVTTADPEPNDHELLLDLKQWQSFVSAPKDNRSRLDLQWMKAYHQEFQKFKRVVRHGPAKTEYDKQCISIPEKDSSEELWKGYMYSLPTKPYYSVVGKINQTLAIWLLEQHVEWLSDQELLPLEASWIFALLARISTVLDPDETFTLRSLGKKLLQIRNGSQDPETMDRAAVLLAIIAQEYGQRDLVL